MHKNLLAIALLTLLPFMGACAQSHAPAEAATLKPATDLQALGAQATARRIPVVLMFSARWCEFCAILKEEVLAPMAANPDYEGKVAFFRVVHIDRDDLPLVDFAGRHTTHHAFAERFDVDLTPTVWIVDGQGRALTEPLVGLPGGTVETYSETLFSRLEEALKKLGHAPVRF